MKIMMKKGNKCEISGCEAPSLYHLCADTGRAKISLCRQCMQQFREENPTIIINGGKYFGKDRV